MFVRPEKWARRIAATHWNRDAELVVPCLPPLWKSCKNLDSALSWTCDWAVVSEALGGLPGMTKLKLPPSVLTMASMEDRSQQDVAGGAEKMFQILFRGRDGRRPRTYVHTCAHYLSFECDSA